ncbi:MULTISPECIES: hypothetical protein [unclassified Blastococcus]|nr:MULTISPECIES: hypothetical protein [unclassified Blastococcus]
MDDERETRPADPTPQTTADEPATGTATAAAVSRMLANPRRVRRA